MQTNDTLLRDIRQSVRSIERLLSDLTQKSDTSLRLQAVATVKGLESEREKVELLGAAGLSATDIDRYLGKASGYSSVVLYQLRKKKQPKEQRDERPETSTPEQSSPKPPPQTLEATA